METGVVKFFTLKGHGGYGFLILDDGSEIYFSMSDGGVPEQGSGLRPYINTGVLPTRPRRGDRIVFLDRKATNRRDRAAPWCHECMWKPLADLMANRKIYRLYQKTIPAFGSSRETEVWSGTDLLELAKRFSGISLTMAPIATGHRAFRFERKVGDEWIPILTNPIEGDRDMDRAGQYVDDQVKVV
jgi:hypothetical protein